MLAGEPLRDAVAGPTTGDGCGWILGECDTVRRPRSQSIDSVGGGCPTREDELDVHLGGGTIGAKSIEWTDRRLGDTSNNHKHHVHSVFLESRRPRLLGRRTLAEI